MQSERNRNRRMSMFQKPEESKKNSSADKTEKIREIYRFLLSETDYLKEIGKEIDEETERLLKENRVNLEKKTYEEVRDELFCINGGSKRKRIHTRFSICRNVNERNYCKALTIFKICSFVSLLQECNSWRISCSMAEDESLYSSERI